MRQLHLKSMVNQLVSFIKRTIAQAGFTKVIVAVSGGVDSATSTVLAAKALGKEHVYCVLLPYKNWHDQAKKDARLLIKNLAIPDEHVYEINITPLVDAFCENSELKTQNSELKRIRIGNIMARVRMVVLFDMAKKLNALVLGTENKSERYLGYFTRFGDEASDIEPLSTLYKTEVFQVAKFLGVPKEIITKAPTAGLWPGQTDEGELGFGYREADEIMYLLIDQKKSKREIINQGFPEKKVVAVTQWIARVSFKHQLPYKLDE